jgi:hypothetical protein
MREDGGVTDFIGIVDSPSDFPDGEVEVIVLPAVDDADDERTVSRPRRSSVDELLAHQALCQDPLVGWV